MSKDHVESSRPLKTTSSQNLLFRYLTDRTTGVASSGTNAAVQLSSFTAWVVEDGLTRLWGRRVVRIWGGDRGI